MRTLILACVSALLFACSSGSGTGGGNAGGAGTAGAASGGGGSGGAPMGGASPGGGGDTATAGGGSSPTKDTWDNFAHDFCQSYCVECHNPNDAARDFNKLGDVMRDAATIRCGVSDKKETGCGASPTPKQFPVGNGAKPSDADRERVVAWIEAGLP